METKKIPPVFFNSTWIVPEEPFVPPAVVAYRLRFETATERSMRFHVTADERYQLWIDGERIGCGPERGHPGGWCYETYRHTFAPGSHLIAAQVWALGDLAPLAQMTVQPGLLLAAEGAGELSTGIAAWEARRLGNYRFADHGGRLRSYYAIGCDLEIHGGDEDGGGAPWRPALSGETPAPAYSPFGHANGGHLLRPAALPPMLERPRRGGTVRFVERLESGLDEAAAVSLSRHSPALAASWQALFDGTGEVTVPAGERLRVIVELGDYVCARPVIRVRNGTGSGILLRWAESLYDDLETAAKGSRDALEGKFFAGPGDRFLPGGGGTVFEPLWWRAGRFLQWEISTANEALVIDDFHLRETRYPLEPESRFASDEPRLEAVHRIGLRTIQQCAHETYMDCPHYEQLMYAGDTRLEMLAHYVLSGDCRLQRKAIELFDDSRDGSGLTRAAFPSRAPQIIPSFSLWWAASVHDFALWRGEPEFVARRMRGIRAVQEAHLGFLNADGLIEAPLGWNFLDWVDGWQDGVPPGAACGVNAALNWQFALALRLIGELERWCGEPELAARAERIAKEHAARLSDVFWDAERNLFADDPARRFFSLHTQCMAALSGLLEPPRREALRQSLAEENGALASTSIYFTHYLFEALRELELEDRWHRRLEPWFHLEAQGFMTTPESPEPSRSDCHGWGAHPLFHSYATLAGIRPAAFGFRKVRIAPFPGPLRKLSCRLVHPAGFVETALVRNGERLTATIELPPGVDGILVWKGKTAPLAPGRQELAL